MKVIATKLGFYGGSRRRVGSEFDLDERALKRDGKGQVVLPSWVVLATPEGRKQAAAAQAFDENRIFEGAKASAGNPANVKVEGSKPGSFVDVMARQGRVTPVKGDDLV